MDTGSVPGRGVQVAPGQDRARLSSETTPDPTGLTVLGRELAQMGARDYFTSVPWVGPGGSFCSSWVLRMLFSEKSYWERLGGKKR